MNGYLLTWSHDPSLQARARTINGAAYTAVELQTRLAEHACRFVATGRADGIVPDVHQIMRMWEETLTDLRSGSLEKLVGRLDFATKLHVILRGMERHGFGWDDPRAKVLDQMYSNLDPQCGLFWAYERAGKVTQLLSEAEMQRLQTQPAEHTRAYLRSAILQGAGDRVEAVDWDRISLREANGRGALLTVRMDNPLRFGRSEVEPVLAAARTLDEGLEALGVLTRGYSGWGQPAATTPPYYGAPGQPGTERSRPTRVRPACTSPRLARPTRGQGRPGRNTARSQRGGMRPDSQVWDDGTPRPSH